MVEDWTPIPESWFGSNWSTETEIPGVPLGLLIGYLFTGQGNNQAAGRCTDELTTHPLVVHLDVYCPSGFI